MHKRKSRRVLIKRRLFRRVLYNYKIRVAPRKMCGGDYAIYSRQIGILQPYQVEVVRLWLSKELKKYRAKLFVRSIYDKPFTKKAKQARMGKGKGKISYFFSRIDENDVLFEIRKPSLEELKLLRKKGKLAAQVQELDRKTLRRLLRRLQYRFCLGVSLKAREYGLRANNDVCNR